MRGFYSHLSSGYSRPTVKQSLIDQRDHDVEIILGLRNINTIIQTDINQTIHELCNRNKKRDLLLSIFSGR